MIYFITGASGSGKTACIPYLKKALNNIAVYDFDAIGVPPQADKIWRQQSTERWLQRYLAEKHEKICICGQVVLGEILACPSIHQVKDIQICLLDCADRARVKRLKERGTYGANQDTLNWAAWLRMHHHDPNWHQHVIKDNCWDQLDFSQWDHLTDWEALARVHAIDTTLLSIPEVTHQLAKWISGKNDECE